MRLTPPKQWIESKTSTVMIMAWATGPAKIIDVSIFFLIVARFKIGFM